MAKKTGVDVPTIRYYELERLLAPPPRSSAGYRQYEATHLETLQFIRHCRSLDISLSEIRMLLDYRENPELACDAVNQLIALHIDQVRDRITQLQQLEEQLLALQGRCGEQRYAKDCGILESLKCSVG